MAHLEVETKFELTAEEFERLRSSGRISRCEDQLNVYYDAEWKLADNSSTLRIRFEDHSDPVLTLKAPVTRHGERRVMKEFELRLSRSDSGWPASHRPVDIDVIRDLPKEFGDCLLCFGVTHVYRVGWVRNTRAVLEVDSVGQIELDRLELPDGTVVYEAEIESEDDSAHEVLSRLVCSYAPEAKPSRLSKFQRFRRAAAHAASGNQAVG